MMLFETFSPFPARGGLVYFSGRTRTEGSCPIRRVPSRLGFLGSLVTASFTPGLQTQLRNRFNPQIWAQGRAKAAWCIASLLCRWQQLPQEVAIPGSPCPPPVPPGHVPVRRRSFSVGSKPLSCGARQQESGFASVVVCAELPTPFIQLLMMGAEAFACPLVPPSGKCNIYFFLRPVQSVQSVLTKASRKSRNPAPNAFVVTAALRRVAAACVGWGGSPGAGSPGAGPAVSDDLMQKYCFMPQKVNYASFTHFCLLLLPPSLLLL